MLVRSGLPSSGGAHGIANELYWAAVRKPGIRKKNQASRRRCISWVPDSHFPMPVQFLAVFCILTLTLTGKRDCHLPFTPADGDHHRQTTSQNTENLD